MIDAVARWAARDRLQPNIADLEVQVSSLSRSVQTVHRHAQALLEDHEAGGH